VEWEGEEREVKVAALVVEINLALDLQAIVSVRNVVTNLLIK
jgi:hypothetical protein